MDKSVRGRKGGLARAGSMTKEERSSVASKAAKTRWSRVEAKKGEDMDDKLIVTVELKSGKFHSRIEVPLFASDESKQSFIKAWFQLIETGIQAGRSAREHEERKTFTNEERLAQALENVGTDNPTELARQVMQELKFEE